MFFILLLSGFVKIFDSMVLVFIRFANIFTIIFPYILFLSTSYFGVSVTPLLDRLILPHSSLFLYHFLFSPFFPFFSQHVSVSASLQEEKLDKLYVVSWLKGIWSFLCWKYFDGKRLLKEFDWWISVVVSFLFTFVVDAVREICWRMQVPSSAGCHVLLSEVPWIFQNPDIYNRSRL